MGSGGGGSSGSSTQTSTVTNQPPDYLEGPITRFMGRAEGLSKTPFSTYDGERIAGLNPLHYQGINYAANTPTLDSAEQMVDSTLRGDYLNQNPYLDATFNRAANQIENRALTSAFGDSSGLSNSGARQELAGNMNRLAEDIYGGNYARERANQFGALQYASQIPEARSRLALGAGDVVRDFDQARINDAIRGFEEQRQHPFQNLDVLGSAIGAGMGGGFGTSTSTQPYYQPNRTASMLGGGLIAADLLRGFA